jgi:hypothetical protein
LSFHALRLLFPDVRGSRYIKKRNYPRDCGKGSSTGCRAAGSGTASCGGRKKISEKYPQYEGELENLLDTPVIGDPEKTLCHISKSAGSHSEALKAQGIQGSPETGRRAFKRLGYRMQGNRKVRSSGAGHPDRDGAQFQYIKRLTKKALKSKNPVIPVDTKKKEVLGAYKNGGKEWYKKEESPQWRFMILFHPTRPAPVLSAYTI